MERRLSFICDSICVHSLIFHCWTGMKIPSRKFQLLCLIFPRSSELSVYSFCLNEGKKRKAEKNNSILLYRRILEKFNGYTESCGTALSSIKEGNKSRQILWKNDGIRNALSWDCEVFMLFGAWIFEILMWRLKRFWFCWS